MALNFQSHYYITTVCHFCQVDYFVHLIDKNGKGEKGGFVMDGGGC